MKTNLLIIALLGLLNTVIAADTIDGMASKVTGGKATGLTPVVTAAQALVDSGNNVLLRSYPGFLRVHKQAPYSALLWTDLVFTAPTVKRTVTVPNGSGTVALHAVAALTSSATISFSPASSVSCYTLTAAHTATVNAVTTGAVSGRPYYLVVTTSGGTAYTLTFGTAFKTTATLGTGTVTAKKFVIEFIFDGVNFNEVSRTAAM